MHHRCPFLPTEPDGDMLAKSAKSLSFFHRTTCMFTRSYHGHFSTIDGTLWKRQLHGVENWSVLLACVLPCSSHWRDSDQALIYRLSRTDGNGFAHVSIGTSVILKPSVPPTKLRESVRNAWIRLRHYAPLIAIRTERGQNKTNYLTYESSKTSDVAAKWAKDTIKWEQEEKTLDVRDLESKERWWGTDDHWNMEMHIGPGPEGRLHFM
jgi:hypothetical protein